MSEEIYICSPILTQIWSNKIINKKYFPTNLKLADVTLVLKKIVSTLAENYRPVRVLPTASKMFEKVIQKQFRNHINKFLSLFLCDCKKGVKYSICIDDINRKMESLPWSERINVAVPMDLSKVFDMINHKLLLLNLMHLVLPRFSKNHSQLLIKALSRCKDQYLLYLLERLHSRNTLRFRIWTSSIQYLSKQFIFSDERYWYF